MKCLVCWLTVCIALHCYELNFNIHICCLLKWIWFLKIKLFVVIDQHYLFVKFLTYHSNSVMFMSVIQIFKYCVTDKENSVSLWQLGTFIIYVKSSIDHWHIASGQDCQLITTSLKLKMSQKINDCYFFYYSKCAKVTHFVCSSTLQASWTVNSC